MSTAKLDPKVQYSIKELEEYIGGNKVHGFRVRMWLNAIHQAGGFLGDLIDADEEGAYEGWLPDSQRVKLNPVDMLEYIALMYASLGLDDGAAMGSGSEDAPEEEEERGSAKSSEKPKSKPKPKKEEEEEGEKPKSRSVRKPAPPKGEEDDVAARLAVMDSRLEELLTSSKRIEKGVDGVNQTAMTNLHETRETREDVRSGFADSAKRLARLQEGMRAVVEVFEPALEEVAAEVWNKPLDEFEVGGLPWGDTDLPPLD